MNDIIKGIFTILVYFFLESILLAIFATIVWKLILFNLIGIDVGYWHWLGIFFIVRMLRLDIFSALDHLNNLINLSNEDEIHEGHPKTDG
jgi:hypothetical protein